jgi:hypothetical protein
LEAFDALVVQVVAVLVLDDHCAGGFGVALAHCCVAFVL